jgi:hypothetical protein
MFGLSLTSIKLIALFAGAVAIAAVAAMTMHKVDLADYEALQLKYAQAQVQAVQKAQAETRAEDQVATNIAVADAEAQGKIVGQTQAITKEVVKYVPDTTHCITYGVLRVLDAHALGRDADTLILPTGKSNDACADIAASDLVAVIASNYDAARANAQQLTDLQAYVREIVKVSQSNGHSN